MPGFDQQHFLGAALVIFSNAALPGNCASELVVQRWLFLQWAG